MWIRLAAQVCLAGPMRAIEAKRRHDCFDLLVIPAGGTQTKTPQHLSHAAGLRDGNDQVRFRPPSMPAFHGQLEKRY